MKTPNNKQTRLLAAIVRHGESLLEAFPDATERDPVKLCKKLRRIEAEAARIGLRLCNGPWFDGVEAWADAEEGKALSKVRALLGLSEADADARGLFVNRDPRGYALKLGDDWTREHNRTARVRIHSDWGGYGLLAPDLRADS